MGEIPYVDWLSLKTRSSRLPFPENTFDIVSAVDILEHLQDEEPFVRELRRIMKPSGTLYLTVPHYNSRLFLKNWGTRGILGRKCLGHLREGYSENQLKTLLQRTKMEVLQTEYFFGFFLELFDMVANNCYHRLARNNTTRGLGKYIGFLSRDNLAVYLFSDAPILD